MTAATVANTIGTASTYVTMRLACVPSRNPPNTVRGSPVTARVRKGPSTVWAGSSRGDSAGAGSVSNVGPGPSAARVRGIHSPSKRCAPRRLASIDPTRRVMTQDTAAGNATLLAGMRSVRMAAAGAVWLAVGLTLTAATGCDKTKALTPDNDSSANASTVRDELDLAKHPTILFEVFGDRTNPQMVPVGVLESGKLHAIHLSGNGWRNFDRIYNHPGATYTLYQ